MFNDESVHLVPKCISCVIIDHHNKCKNMSFFLTLVAIYICFGFAKVFHRIHTDTGVKSYFNEYKNGKICIRYKILSYMLFIFCLFVNILKCVLNYDYTFFVFV